MRFPHFIVPLFVGFSLSAPVDAAAIFAQGVTEQSGWYDTNKTGNNDGNLCWAAATSNILQWWQDKGTYVPAGTPNGTVAEKPHQSVIFDSFKENWKNVGGGAGNGFRWYLGGIDLGSIKENLKPDKQESGKYWDDYIKEIGYDKRPSDPWQSYLPVVYNYHAYENFATNFATNIVNLLQNNAALTLSIVGFGTSFSHSITLWGIDYEQSILYITDSDDGDGLKTYHFTKQEYNPGSDPGEKIVLTDYIFGNAYINDYNALTLPFAIPEPSSVLLSLLGGSLLCLSRRRR